jgi:hypothetical protein
VGEHPVRRWTSSEAAAQCCPRIDANIVEYAYFHQGSSTAIAIFGQCLEGVMSAYSSGVLDWRAAEAAMVPRSGDSGPVMSWWRPLASAAERRQASRDVSAGDQRYPAIGGGQPVLAAGAGAGQQSGEALAVDRCPGDRDRAPALGERLPGVPVADRVAERRGGVGVQAAQRDTAGNPAVAGSADHVAMVSRDLGHRTVARDNTSVPARAGRLRSRGPGPGQRYRASSAAWRLSGRGPRLEGRGPGLEASADSGEGLANLA